MRTPIDHPRAALPGLLAAGAIAVAVAGCGGSSKPSRSTTSASPTAAHAPAATGALVSARSTSLGAILVDGQGRTVYQFAKDKPGKSSCTGACAQTWPFVKVAGSLPRSLPGVTGRLGTTVRAGGAHQLTVSGHPVYTFAGDSAAGQTNGQNLTLNGGLWTVLSPSGAIIGHHAAAPATTSSAGGY